jgi:uncharacterized protein YigA (DUF484 family)
MLRGIRECVAVKLHSLVQRLLNAKRHAEMVQTLQHAREKHSLQNTVLRTCNTC